MCLETLYLGDKGTTILRNVGKYSLNDTASHSTRVGFALCFTSLDHTLPNMSRGKLILWPKLKCLEIPKFTEAERWVHCNICLFVCL